MLALPNQTMEILKKSLQEVIKLAPEHISLYSLIIEEGTLLFDKVEKGEVKPLSDEEERKMYWETKKMLEQAKYQHYEISNFAKKGFESKHNSDCWNQKEYIGIGAASHSYLGKKRYYNIENIEKYIQNIKNENFEKNVIINEIQEKEDEEKEFVLLGLRKIQGVSIDEFEEKFGENLLMKYSKEIQKVESQNLIKITKDKKIKLTNKGLDLANIVWEEFV